MSHPKEAWYPYMKNITRKYPNNLHPEENAAVSAALATAAPDTVQLIELAYIKGSKTLREAANLCFLSISTARIRTSAFFREVARNLGLPTK